jgi:hypothetical protein
MVDGDVRHSPEKELDDVERLKELTLLYDSPEPLDSLNHRLLLCHIRPTQCDLCPRGSNSLESLYASTSMPSTLRLCNINHS